MKDYSNINDMTDVEFKQHLNNLDNKYDYYFDMYLDSNNSLYKLLMDSVDIERCTLVCLRGEKNG